MPDRLRDVRRLPQARLEIGQLLLVRPRQHLDQVAPRRRHPCLLPFEKDAQGDRRVDLLRRGQIVGQILGDLPRDDRDGAGVGLTRDSHLRAGFANDVQHPPANNRFDVELSIGSRRRVGERSVDVAPHRAERVRLGDDPPERPLAIEA